MERGGGGTGVSAQVKGLVALLLLLLDKCLLLITNKLEYFEKHSLKLLTLHLLPLLTLFLMFLLLQLPFLLPGEEFANVRQCARRIRGAVTRGGGRGQGGEEAAFSGEQEVLRHQLDWGRLPFACHVENVLSF